MTSTNPELSSRYYVAEAAVWLLGLTLVAIRFVGIAPSQNVPYLGITPEKYQYYPHIVAGLLAAATVYLLVEWHHSGRDARKSYKVIGRKTAAIFAACASLWISYPVIAASSRFSSISPAWFLAFITLGFMLRGVLSVLVLATVVIRSSQEAKTLGLRRVPIASICNFRLWLPILILIIAATWFLYITSPVIVRTIAIYLISGPIVLFVTEEYSWLCLSQDKDGNRIPYAKRISGLKKAFASHDYAYLLNSKHPEAKEIFGETESSPLEIQKKIQERCRVDNPFEGGEKFYVRVNAGITVGFEAKGSKGGNTPKEIINVQILTDTKHKPIIQAEVVFVPPRVSPQIIDLQTSIVENNSLKYLSTHNIDSDKSVHEMLSYALKQTVIDIWLAKARKNLPALVDRGDERAVRELLDMKVDVNQQAQFGWTALLAASAQGYLNLVQLLLDAAANPDIGNLKGITPLMYAVRYNNLEIAKLLIKYGANLNLQDNQGMTALMASISFGNPNAAKLLLEAGADTSIKDIHKKTALDWAHHRGLGGIAKLLRNSKKS